MKSKYFTFFVAMFALVQTVYADTSDLTDDNVRNFYKESIDVQLAGLKPTMDFMKKHTHKDAKTVINVISNMAGAPQQKQTLSMNKEELLRETQKGMEMGGLQSIESTILVLKISEDGQSANVKDSTYSEFTMSMNAPHGVVTFRAEQSMLCDSLIVLNDEGVIQSKDNNCSSEINIKPVQ